MTTIPLSPFAAQLEDGTPCHVIGVDPDNTPARFVIMRHGTDGRLLPDFTAAVFGVSLDEEVDADDHD